MRILKLELKNWRNFTSADVDLAERVFVVGPNAAGKSNFLDVFRFLADIAAEGGGLRSAISKRGGVSTIRSLAARRYPDVIIDVTIGEDDDSENWRYRLEFFQNNQARPFVRREEVWLGSTRLLERPDRQDKEDLELLAQTHLEQVAANKSFREVSNFFRTIRYRHIVPQLIREPDRISDFTEDPYGGNFLEQMARTQDRTRNSRLAKIANALRVALPQLNELELFRDERGTPHLRGRYEHWRPQGAWQTEEQFSDGTLRLIGLLWAFLDTGGPLLLEEPELSLHPEVVRQLPRLMSRMQRRSSRQLILTTHSPDLLSDPGIGLDEVLLLTPNQEGAQIRSAGSIDEIRTLLTHGDAGLNLGDIVIPRTRPKNVQQLSMFDAY